jgi:hypothetical protein
MAIGKMIGLGGNPIYDAFDSRRNALMGIGAGLLSGDWGNIGRYAMAGREADDAYATQQKAEALRQQEVNKTAEWLRANYPQFADLPPAEGFRLATQLIAQQQKAPIDPTDTAEGRQQLAAQFGLEGAALQEYVLTGKLPGGNQTVRAGLGQPIPLRNKATGETVPFMPMSDGTYINPLTQQIADDTWEFDPAYIAAQRSMGTEQGKRIGAAQFDLPSAALTRDQTLAAIEDIRAQTKGMDEQFGNVLGVPQQLTPAWPGSEKAKFQVAVERAVNRAFLEARQMLKGGGQITDFESRKAEAAITSMQIAMEKGDKAQFEKAVADFEKAVIDGFNKLQVQAGQMLDLGAGAAAPPADDIDSILGGYGL